MTTASGMKNEQGMHSSSVCHFGYKMRLWGREEGDEEPLSSKNTKNEHRWPLDDVIGCASNVLYPGFLCFSQPV